MGLRTKNITFSLPIEYIVKLRKSCEGGTKVYEKTC